MASSAFSGCSLKFLSTPTPLPPSSFPRHFRIKSPQPLSARPLRLFYASSFHCHSRQHVSSISGGGNGNINCGGGGGGGGGGDGNGNEGGNAGDRNKEEALKALADAGQSLDSLPEYLAAAIQAGEIPGAVVSRFLKLEECPLVRWLLQFGGMKERLLADDLFLAKAAIESGVCLCTMISEEYDHRKENFWEELDIVLPDVMMAMIADFMLLYLPAPTVSLRRPLGDDAGHLAKFFRSCPTNAFQVAVAGYSYSLLQRMGAFALTGAKLLAVGTASSLVGTSLRNAWVNLRKAIDKSSAGEVENVPIWPTSIARGSYMAVFSNLRYQVLAGLVEQRILEPLLHGDLLSLCAVTFVVRAGNAFPRPLTRPTTSDKGNEPSGNELIKPTSNAIEGTRNVAVLPLNPFMGEDTNGDWKGKISKAITPLASFCMEMIREKFNPGQWFNPPGTSA